MKKNLIFYSLIWISLFGLFNLLTFIIPAWPNLEKYTYETTVTDYFLHGDITFDSEVIVKVTITDNYFDYVQDLTNIIVKYVGYFTNKCQVYYEVLDSRLVYLYEVKNKKEKNLDNCNEEEHCCCGHHHDHECCCDHHAEGHECECGHEHCNCNHEKE